MTGTNLQGTNVISMIVPTNHADTYATHDSFYGKGGWREVNTLAERDLIPQERRRQGMVVFVRETYKAYILKNSVYNGGWVPFPATEDVTDIINAAIDAGNIEIDLTSYATKADVSEEFQKYYTSVQVDSLVGENVASIKEWVQEQGYLTQHQSLDNYVTKEEFTDALSLYVLESTLEQELESYVTSESLDNKLQEYIKASEIAEIYATKEEVDEKVQEVSDGLDEISEKVTTLEEAGYVTEEQLNEKGYINEDNAKDIISGYGYIDNEALESALQPYATIEAINEVLKAYAKSEDVERAFEEAGYLTVADLQGYATELWVHDYLINNNYLVVRDLQGYATELWVQDYVSALTGGSGAEIDLTSYQKKEDVTLETESKTIVGAINELASKTSEVPDSVYSKAEVDEKISDAISEIQIPSIDGLATEQWVENKNYLTEHQDISNLATKLEVEAKQDKGDYAEFSKFSYGGQERKTIQLANYDSISGIGADCREGQPNGYEGGEDLSAEGMNLVMLSKWNVADFGSPKVHFNLNTKDNVTINDDKIVATTEYVDNKVAAITGGSGVVTMEQYQAKCEEYDNIIIIQQEKIVALEEKINAIMTSYEVIP